MRCQSISFQPDNVRERGTTGVDRIDRPLLAAHSSPSFIIGEAVIGTIDFDYTTLRRTRAHVFKYRTSLLREGLCARSLCLRHWRVRDS